MIHRFRVIVPHKLYRGSSPTIHDVKHLQDKFGIKKIVSLDHGAGEKIDRTCKLLNIKHVKMYIEGDRRGLLHFVSQDLKKLFLEGGPTFMHCHYGKDRTGLATALIECKYLGKSPEQAIKDIKKLGFGVGVPPHIVHMYEKLIRACKPVKSQDQNSADIVSNEREYIGDNRDSYLDEVQQGSFAPFLDPNYQYQYTVDQFPTRQNYDQPIIPHSDETNAVPTVGIFNNDAGISGAGPTINMTGFIYD